MAEKLDYRHTPPASRSPSPRSLDHALTLPPPGGKPPGERLATYFENFFKTIVGIATLGASLTFNKIVDNSTPSPAATNPSHTAISPQRLLTLLSLSWLFFVLALAFTSFFASALSLWRPAAVKAFGTENTNDRRRVLWVASGVSALLLSLVIIAFMMLSLVVAGFVGGPGWTAVAFTVIFGVLSLGTVVWRSPMEWPNRWQKTDWRRRGQHPDGGDEGSLVSEKIRRGGTHDGLSRGNSLAGGSDDIDFQAVGTLPQRQQTTSGRGYGDYGRSTSGDYQNTAAGNNAAYRYGSSGGGGGGGGAGGATWRTDAGTSRTSAGYDYNRYSKASTVIPDVYEPSGRVGQRNYSMYDDGVREGLVMSRYDR